MNKTVVKLPVIGSRVCVECQTDGRMKGIVTGLGPSPRQFDLIRDDGIEGIGVQGSWMLEYEGDLISWEYEYFGPPGPEHDAHVMYTILRANDPS